MKKTSKKAWRFTLAETLITLAIIGVCAAMLITTIKNINPNEASNLVMARKAVGTFTEATRQVLLFNSQTKRWIILQAAVLLALLPNVLHNFMANIFKFQECLPQTPHQMRSLEVLTTEN